VWTGGTFAAEATQQNGDSLLVLIGGIIIAAMVPLGSVIVEIVKGRNSRTTASPPAPSPFPGAPSSSSPKDVELYERTAALNERLRQKDEADHLRDRMLATHSNLLDEHGDVIQEQARDIRWIKKHLGLGMPDA
jgi:hypothetical protein